MTAYSTIYRALTSGRPVSAAEAAQLLAQLRQDHGDEFADLLRQHARTEYAVTATESHADARRRRRSYGAVTKAAVHLTTTAKAPRT